VSLVFRNGVAEVAVFLEYDVTSPGNLFPTFRGNEAFSSSSVEMSKIAALGISMHEHEIITFLLKVENRFPNGVT
jgi:hypothetical protein